MLIPLKPRPEFDLCKVYDIRNQLDEDTFSVDSQQIADKMLEFEVALDGQG
jgi:anti-sigma28 factor (negative regulator of flagellin synthesis)